MSREGGIGARARRAAVWRSNAHGFPFMPAKNPCKPSTARMNALQNGIKWVQSDET